MRAVAITDFGSEPEVLELPVPQPGPGEILLRIHAAGMNPFDWKVAAHAPVPPLTRHSRSRRSRCPGCS